MLLRVETTADRRAGGPYTVAAALARVLVPLAPAPVIAEHDLELRAVAPDLDVPVRRDSLAASADRSERILVPAPQRTLRIANGFAAFVRDVLAALSETLLLVVSELPEADPADREVLAALARRAPAFSLEEAAGPAPRPRADGPVRWYAGDAADHQDAAEWCLDRGCHHAVIELARLGLALEDPAGGSEVWWNLVHHLAVALGALEREEEAEAVLKAARALTTDPSRHSTMAYTSAMLLTRHHLRERRDLDGALGWVNLAIALSDLLPDPENRAVKLGFDLNGKALIMARRGDLDAAMELVEESMRLAATLPPGAQPIHRLVLRVNRAQLRILTGDRDGALEDLDAAVAADPGYPDYYVDRGNLLFAAGRHDEALADYNTALAVGPPFAEAHYNRSEVLFARGDLKGALQDLDTALELDPSLTDARANRAGLLVALGEPELARSDVDEALAGDPGNPYLLCTLGQIEGAAGRYREARAAFDRAVEQAPSLAVAWAGRGILAFENGRPEEAVADLGRALELGEDPGLLFNRALAHRAAGRPDQAERDLRRAAELDPADPEIRAALAD
ncbi:hypothetical protein GCM10010468_56460 [Actinocorallia longicatena]|uniref:Tetratricopeptide repeat protein n=1 Tax=Actinocorallia longicatena TaxID=111803 RepID=A0ABP6QM31_9ACTN